MPTRKEACHDLKIWRGVLGRILNDLEAKGNLKRVPFGVIQFKVMK